MAIPFPALRPTRWELQLPGYPVIGGNWRSTEYPEILGNIPSKAVLRLSFENIKDVDAAALLLLWRATASGRFELDPLPADVAAGVTDATLADRLLDIAPLVWTVSGEPTRQDSIKAGRSSVEIELTSELRMSASITPSGISCPTYAARPLVGCVGGADGVGNWPGYDLGDWGGGQIDYWQLTPLALNQIETNVDGPTIPAETVIIFGDTTPSIDLDAPPSAANGSVLWTGSSGLSYIRNSTEEPRMGVAWGDPGWTLESWIWLPGSYNFQVTRVQLRNELGATRCSLGFNNPALTAHNIEWQIGAGSWSNLINPLTADLAGWHHLALVVTPNATDATARIWYDGQDPVASGQWIGLAEQTISQSSFELDVTRFLPNYSAPNRKFHRARFTKAPLYSTPFTPPVF